jgi:hypothetical protein
MAASPVFLSASSIIVFSRVIQREKQGSRRCGTSGAGKLQGGCGCTLVREQKEI